MIAVLTLFVLLPVVLGANPYRKFLKDATFCQEKDAVCKMSSGSHGCCPAVDGVCCADGDHCCPSGFKCDLSAKQCLQYGDPALYVLVEDMLDVTPIGSRVTREITKGVEAHGMQNSVPADSFKFLELVKTLSNNINDVMCPGNEEECPDGNTCCLSTSGDYACCPLPGANCCDDYLHCCPSGYTCDAVNKSCTKSALDCGKETCPKVTTDLIKLVKDDIKHEDVTCADGQVCPGVETCCLNTEGGYSCCPDPNAVCCNDHIHCCPSGYSCDIAQGTCNKLSPDCDDKETCPNGTVIKIDLIKHVEGNIKHEDIVVCPDLTICPSGSTCCPNNEGSYGCCPISNAVCCSDGVHCCPSDYTCVSSEGCIKSSSLYRIPFLTKSPTTRRL